MNVSGTSLLPKIAVDAVLFAVDSQKLKVLLVKITQGPYKDMWSLPGGKIDYNETLENAVKRHLFDKTNITGIYLEQLYTFGNPKRDKRFHSISVAYFALVPNLNALKIRTKHFWIDTCWCDTDDLPKLAFDHKEIINLAHSRLTHKMTHSNIVYNLLPNNFTLTQLQNVYEIILHKKVDKRNFRKKILAMNLIEKSNKQAYGQAFRPAELYNFKHRKLVNY